MKKILALLLLAILAVGSYLGYQYYTQTYAGTVAYARIPKEVPAKEPSKLSNGEVERGYFEYNYQLTFVKENGETQEMAVTINDKDPQPFEPNSLVKAEISQKRVIKGPNQVAENQVPQTVLEKLK